MLKSDSSFCKAAKETLVEYFQKTSLNGFGLLYYIRRRKYQRVFWFMFIVLGIGFATYVVLYTLLDFLENPTVTTLETQYYDIQNIPFPAVAVCSANKLSRRAVEAYVQKMRSQRSNQRQYWYDRLKLLAGFFGRDAVDFDEAAELQRELLDINAGAFNVADLLRELAPPCEDLLVMCRWAGHPKACSEMFQLHAIAAGYCCMFNYRRAIASTGTAATTAKPLFHPEGSGMEMGLTLLLNSSALDYYLTEGSSRGFSVQIFDVSDFPDDSSGNGLRQIFVPPGSDVQVQLSAITQTTTREVRAFCAQKRRCYFVDEHVAAYGLDYSHSECLTRCKALSMLRRCGCVPYYMPTDFLHTNASAVAYCTLAQLECMERYRVMWNTYSTATQDSTQQRLAEQQESLACTDCLPLCSYNYYSYFKHTSPLRDTHQLPENLKLLRSLVVDDNSQARSCQDQSKSGDEVANCSLLKLFFSTPFAVQYRKKALYNWYQILSNIGGVIGICMGCSLISVFELIYFCSFRLFEKVHKHRKTTRES